MSDIKLRAAVVFVAPAVILAGFLYQPYISDFTDVAEFGETVAAGPNRWLLSRVVLATGLVLLILAVFAIRLYLHEAGEDQWSFPAVPLVTVGASVFIFVLGFRGLAGWTIAERGGGAAGIAEFFDKSTFADAAFPIGGVIFSLGLLSLAVAVKASGTLADSAARVVVIAIVINVIAGFIPMGWAIYITGFVGFAVFWPIAYQMWQDASATPTPNGSSGTPDQA